MARLYRLLLGSLIQCIGLIPLGFGALAVLSGLASGLGGGQITIEGAVVPWWFALFAGLVLVAAGIATIGYGLRLAQRLDPPKANPATSDSARAEGDPAHAEGDSARAEGDSAKSDPAR